jgi:hypothetical protein
MRKEKFHIEYIKKISNDLFVWCEDNKNNEELLDSIFNGTVFEKDKRIIDELGTKLDVLCSVLYDDEVEESVKELEDYFSSISQPKEDTKKQQS